MPSMLTAASSSSTANIDGAGRMLSKVNSFQRTWDDDEPSSSASGKIPWSSSPEPLVPFSSLLLVLYIRMMSILRKERKRG